MAAVGLPQLLMNAIKSLARGVVKHVLSPKGSFNKLVKRGKNVIKNSDFMSDALLKDGKKFLNNKLNFKKRIGNWLDNKKVELTDKVLGISSRQIYERHKYINKLKKSGASLQEIMEFEKEFGLDPDRAKSHYQELKKQINSRPNDISVDISDEDLPSIPETEKSNEMGMYVAKSFNVLKRASSNETKGTIDAIIDLNKNLYDSNNDIVNELVGFVNESNLSSSKNFEEVQRMIAQSSQLSSNIQEKLAKMTEDQSSMIVSGFKNIEDSLSMYSDASSQKMDMLASLAEMAEDKPEDDSANNSFSEILKTNSLIADLVSNSLKSPAEMLQSFEMAMNEVFKDLGKEVGFYGNIIYDGLKTFAKKGGFLAEGAMKPVLGLLASLLGITMDEENATPEQLEAEDKKILKMGYHRRQEDIKTYNPDYNINDAKEVYVEEEQQKADLTADSIANKLEYKNKLSIGESKTEIAQPIVNNSNVVSKQTVYKDDPFPKFPNRKKMPRM